MRICVTGPAIGLVLLYCAVSWADVADTTMVEQRFAQLDPLPTPQFPGGPAPNPVMLPNGPAPTPLILPAGPTPLPSQSVPWTPPVDAPQQQLEVGPPEVFFKESPYRSPAWMIEFDLIPTLPQFTEAEFGSWTDDGALALRLKLGFEDDIGIGTRVTLWAFGQEVSTLATKVDLGASTFTWDMYRRLYIEDSELIIGGGPIGAHLEFDFPQLDEHARFNGGGASVFGEGYFPLVHFKKTDIASIFRARISVVRGEWRDSGTPFVPDTDHDSLTITDVAWGFELRRRFGPHEDRYWLLRLLPEYQRWDSAWLSDFAHSNLAFVGTSISFGLAW